MVNSQKLLKIAVTGGAASGKSTVCRQLEGKGLPVISLDALSREVVMPGMAAYNVILDSFGAEILLEDGTLNRAELRDRITQDPGQKRLLESIVQPAILEAMQARIDEYRSREQPAVVVEVPLLFETGMDKDFDLSILVAVDRDVQVRRLSERDGVTEAQAKALVDIQMPLEEKAKRADLVLFNNSNLEDLMLSTDKMFEKHIEKTMHLSKALDR